MNSVKKIMIPVNECLTPNQTLNDAIKFMKKTKWNTVPVTDITGKLIGVFTRSALYQMLLLGLGQTTPIANYIKEGIGTVTLDTTFEELEEIIAISEVGTGIVIDDFDKPIGLITTSSAVLSFLHSTRSLKGQLETILHTSNLGALMTDERGKIIFVNDKLTNMLKQPLERLMLKDLQQLIPNMESSSLKKEVHFRMNIDSDYFVVRLSYYNMPNGKKGYIALFQNVSELENMAQELQMVKKWKSILQTVIENAYDGLVMINENGEIIFISPSLIELFELDDKTIEQMPVNDILPHLELTPTLKTGVADISDFMEIKGINYMVQRIPVYQDDQIIGVIGKIVYRQLHEVRERFRRYEDIEKKMQISSRKTETSRFTFKEILSQDPQMEKLMRSGIKAAKGRTTILIRGESGTGKELFAHAIHSSSSSGQGPFITVNCAAIPEHLLESEFFGYEEGAFTGAKQKGKMGKFDLANGGTLFLDEVGDMSLQLQAKLLRVLQEREFYRVGGTERIEVNVRIIAATNRPLEEMVESGEFREDLFYRLNVISFEIPPLRKRKKDILLLSEAFIQELNKQNGTSIIGWDPVVQQAMMDYDWPGNIRELRNVWERAMVFSENGYVRLVDLPDYLLKKVGYDLLIEEEETGNPEQSLLEKAEQIAIQKALIKSNGNKSQACKLLGISRSVLYDKLKKYETIEVN
ncbi:sigma 54-interacting transcriptional regulator [Alkalihalobacterium elongatum]|uniref:sigma 54-interacting transcriptional regulator n=1 Tax=Alkalihalobacterium elongatum TaxID=2675466 RepID=UPI001C1F60FD|nr:sigma 54-interacting transcriptional regulator [Alkalihalobacterium elongatum]